MSIEIEKDLNSLNIPKSMLDCYPSNSLSKKKLFVHDATMYLSSLDDNSLIIQKVGETSTKSSRVCITKAFQNGKSYNFSIFIKAMGYRTDKWNNAILDIVGTNIVFELNNTIINNLHEINMISTYVMKKLENKIY